MPNPDGSMTPAEQADLAARAAAATPPGQPLAWMPPNLAPVTAPGFQPPVAPAVGVAAPLPEVSPAVDAPPPGMDPASARMWAAQQALKAGKDPNAAGWAEKAAQDAGTTTIKSPAPASPFPTAPAAQQPNTSGTGLKLSLGSMGANPYAGLLGAFDKATGEQKKALLAGAEAEGAAVRAQQAALKEKADFAETYAREEAAINARHQTEMNNLKDDIMQNRIDPKRLWNSKSDGEKAGSLIGIILSGIGSGLTGQPNAALAVIDKAIERDINAQTAEMDKKKTLYSMNLEQYGQERVARAATYAQKIAGFEAQLQAAALTSGDAKAKAHAQYLMGELEKNRIPLMQTVAQFELQQRMLAMAGGVGGGDQYENGQHATVYNPMDFAERYKAANADKERALPPRTPGGKQVLAHSASAATTARNQLQGITGAEHVLNQIEAQRDATTGIGWSNDKKAVEVKLHDLAYELARAKVGGTPGAEAVADFQSMLAGPFTAWVRGEGAFQPIKDIMESQRAAIYETHAPGMAAKVTVPFKPVR